MPKSYSGCLRCRRQKIKCDQVIPTCTNCLNSKSSCEYASGLRWSKDDRSVLRRPIEKTHFPPGMRFSPSDVHKILDSLDGIQLTSDTSIGPFTVFGFAEHTLPSESLPSERTLVSHVQQEQFNAHDNSPIQIFHGSSPTSPGSRKQYDSRAPLDMMLRDDTQPSFVDSTTSLPNAEAFQSHIDILREDLLDCFCGGFSSKSPDQNAEDVLFERISGQTWPMNQLSTELTFSIMRFTELAQGLLVYTTQVFTPDNSVRASSSNMWSTFFTPPALSAIGDIIANGTTTASRYATLCAILTCGAFRARQSFSQDSLEYAFCTSLGQRLYDGSRYFLGKWLKDQLPEKYDDGLVALITLMMAQFITEDRARMEKTMCLLQRVVNKKLQDDETMSYEASALHRAAVMPILLSRVAIGFPELQTIDALDSSVWIDSAYAEMFPSYEDTFSDTASKIAGLDSRRSFLTHLQEQVQIQEYIEQYVSDIPKEVFHGGESKSDFSDGVPASLIFLFKEAVMISELRQKQITGPSGEFFKRSTLLEAALANWERVYEPPLITIPIGENSPAAMDARWSAILSHNTFAFYDGLLLFHYCENKDADPRLFQVPVRRIIDNLERITCLNLELRERITIPILFPGFLGACLAVESDPSLCSRYELWLGNMNTFSIYPRGDLLQVVKKVWECSNNDQPHNWKVIARELNMAPNMF